MNGSICCSLKRPPLTPTDQKALPDVVIICLKKSSHVPASRSWLWPHAAHVWCSVLFVIWLQPIFRKRHVSVTRHLSSAHSSLEVCGFLPSQRLYNRQIQSSITPLFPIISTLHISARLFPSLPPSLLYIPPLLSLKAETYNFPASLRPSARPAALCMYIHTSARTKHAQASRPRELPQCIMTDNWLLWVWPQQREPITMTATSL